MKVKNYGLKKEFIDRYDVHDVLADNGITNESIALDIQELIDVKGL